MAKLHTPLWDRVKPPPPPRSPRPPAPYKKRPPSAPPPYRKTSGELAPSLCNDDYMTVNEARAELEVKREDYAEVNEQEVVESVSKAKYDLVMERFKKVLSEKKELMIANQQLEERVKDLQSQLNKMIVENSCLRTSVSHSPPPPSPPTLTPTVEPPTEKEEEEEEKEDLPVQEPIYASVDKSKKLSHTSSGMRFSGQDQIAPHPEQTTPTEDLYTVPNKKSKSSSTDTPPIVTPPPPEQDTPVSGSTLEEAPDPAPVGTNPPVDLVHCHIKTLTQVIQELLKAVQSHQQAHFSPCSLKIVQAVDSLTRIFPTKPASQAVRVSLQEVNNATQKLQTECQDGSQSDLAFRTRQIISSAYDVAKAARHLVMCVEQDNKNGE